MFNQEAKVMSVIDHVEIAVKNAQVSLKFFEAALAPLGFSLIISLPPERTLSGGARYGLGPEGYPRLWLHDKDITGASTHLAFAASERAIVDEYWRAALQAGGRDNGAPGIRDHYHPHYYAAFILDPDGNNIEVVCQKG